MFVADRNSVARGSRTAGCSTRRTSFTDFIDVTEHLVALKYVAKDKVFASGGSAGGLLVGAVSNMAPQDYRGIIAYVPFVDAGHHHVG